jgi:hypothetical protein
MPASVQQSEVLELNATLHGRAEIAFQRNEAAQALSDLGTPPNFLTRTRR